MTDYTFSLCANPDAATQGIGTIKPLTTVSTQPFVGRIQNTFKALGGNAVSTAWRKHYSDTRSVISATQPLYITNVQQMVDFIDGYSDYLASIGFSSTTTDVDNTDPNTGRLNGWQP